MSNTATDLPSNSPALPEGISERGPNTCKSNQADLTRWLAINHLEKSTCLKLLDRLLLDKFGIATSCSGITSESINVDPFQAWKICSDAISWSIPALSPIAEKVFAETPKCLQPKNRIINESFTYDRGFNKTPFIYVDYQRSSKSLIAVAHEFGHAVQITANNDGRSQERMSPVSRECCAFIAELCLIHYAQHCTPALFSGLVAVWVRDNFDYLVNNAGVLTRAFETDRAGYHYSWNYPIARVWSHFLWKEQHDCLTLFFSTNSALSTDPWSLDSVLSSSNLASKVLYEARGAGDA